MIKRSFRSAVGGTALALTVVLGGVVVLTGSAGPFRGPPARTEVMPAAAGGFVVTERYRFTVGPEGGRFTLGADTIVIPPRAICDPRTSQYGPAAWERPCRAAREPLEIFADVREPAAASEGAAGSERWIDFSPPLRFVPSEDSTRWVRLTFRGAGAAADSVTWRRIQHFSGYQVHAG